MTALTETQLPANPEFSQTGVELTMDAGDAGSGNEIPVSGKIILIAHNTDASPQTIGITSTAEKDSGRTGDVSEVLAADQYHVFVLQVNGWANASLEIDITVTDAAIKLGWFYVP